MGRLRNSDRIKTTIRVDDPIDKLINLTSFGYEFFRISEAVQLLGIRTVGDLSRLDPKRLLQNPSLNRQQAERLLGVLEKWQQLPFVKKLNEQWGQPKFLKESALQPPQNASDRELRTRQEEILTQVAGVMHVDGNFLERGIVRRAMETLTGITLSSLDAMNLGVALGVAPFREYLGLRVLGEVTQRQ